MKKLLFRQAKVDGDKFSYLYIKWDNLTRPGIDKLGTEANWTTSNENKTNFILRLIT